jgi:aminoglycoside 3-N-acetyltransferase
MRHDYEENQIRESIEKVGIEKGDAVFVHSNLGFFGRLEKAKSKDDYCVAFEKAIFQVIGTEGTLVVPTFSYSFCRKKDFYPLSTESDCGMFSDYIMTNGGLRSHDANFSVASKGFLAKYFTERPTEHSFGENSFFDRFRQKKGKILNFNFDAGSTYIHYVEKKLQVPYRYDKAFQGNVITEEGQEEKVFVHFVYDHDKEEHSPDFPAFSRRAEEIGQLKKASLGKGEMVSISAESTFDLIQEELKCNPCFLIKAHEMK